jgi:hypothetical protein
MEFGGVENKCIALGGDLKKKYNVVVSQPVPAPLPPSIPILITRP